MAKPLRCRIAGCLLLEPPTESLLQAPSRSRKAAYACSGRMCPQAPHLRQHRSRPRHLLEVLRSHYVMVAQDEDGWAYAESRLVTEPFALVHYLTMSNSPWDGLSASKSPSYPPLRDRLGRRPRREDGDSLAQLHFVVNSAVAM